MQNGIPPIEKKYLTPTKFYEVQPTKCTKTLFQTDTIRPLVLNKQNNKMETCHHISQQQLS